MDGNGIECSFFIEDEMDCDSRKFFLLLSRNHEGIVTTNYIFTSARYDYLEGRYSIEDYIAFIEKEVDVMRKLRIRDEENESWCFESITFDRDELRLRWKLSGLMIRKMEEKSI